MNKNYRKSLTAGLFTALLAAAGTVQATEINLTFIGTWTTSPGSATQDAALQTDGKYVIHTSYDPALTPTTTRTINGLDFQVINLDDAATSLGHDSFQVLIPMEGFDGGTPFVYDQNQDDPFSFGSNVPEPEIHFTDASGSAASFFGFEFEGDFEPGATTNFVELRTEVAAIDPGDGSIVLTPSQVIEIRRQEDGAGNADSGGAFFPQVIRSIDSLAAAVDPVAEAGPDQQFSAGQLTVETDVNAFVDNDLGAGRADGEDFLTYDWTEGGSALTGTATTAVRPDGRTVDDVNIAVAIQDSGLTSTIDTVTWQVEINEDLTGFGGSTDTMTVSYDNALPLVANASATAQLGGLLFELDVDDLDLGVNSLIAGFEMLMIDILVDSMDESAFFMSLIDAAIDGTSATQFASGADLLTQFGLGMHLFEVTVTDKAGALGSASFQFDVGGTPPAPVPEPTTILLLCLGLTTLVLQRNARRRRLARMFTTSGGH